MSNEPTPFQDLSAADLAAAHSSGVPPMPPPGKAEAAGHGDGRRSEDGQFPKQGADGKWRDKARTIFDPAKHRAHADGSPVVGAKGFFRGLPAAVSASAVSSPQAVQQPQQSGPQAVSTPESGGPGEFKLDDTPETPNAAPGGGVASEFAAKKLVAQEEIFAVLAFGTEMQFLDEEKTALVMAWVEAFKTTGVIDSPWYIGLLTAHAAIIKNRMANAQKYPATSSRLLAVRDKLLGYVTTVLGWCGFKFATPAS